MEQIYESKDPVLALPIQLPASTQVQKSSNKKKSKNKKSHTVNTMMNDEIRTTIETAAIKIDQRTNDNIDSKSILKHKVKEPGGSATLNGIVKTVDKFHIKDNGHCLSNGSNVRHNNLNGHEYSGVQHDSEIAMDTIKTITTTTTTTTPANQITTTVNEKSKKCKSKPKNKDHCHAKQDENCIDNDVASDVEKNSVTAAVRLVNINTGKPTVLSTAKETAILTDNQNDSNKQQQQQQIQKARDIIATAAAAASIPIDMDEFKSEIDTEAEVEIEVEALTLVTEPALEQPKIHIDYTEYQSELQMQDIMRLIQAELSEPYSIYTYRYFIYNWPKLCFLAAHGTEYVGAIVCKLDMHVGGKRGYIAMLAVRKEYRNLKIGTTLVQKAIEAMVADNADEVVLETEMRNYPALHLYENLGFVRDKRLFRYYLNGVDALRLKLWFR